METIAAFEQLTQEFKPFALYGFDMVVARDIE